MNLSPDMDLTLFIKEDKANGDRLVTDSRSVGLLWEKRHYNVLRDINGMFASEEPEIREFARLNFEGCTYEDRNRNVRKRPMQRMTADGLSNLAMCFRGEDAGRGPHPVRGRLR